MACLFIINILIVIIIITCPALFNDFLTAKPMPGFRLIVAVCNYSQLRTQSRCVCQFTADNTWTTRHHAKLAKTQPTAYIRPNPPTEHYENEALKETDACTLAAMPLIWREWLTFG